MTILAQISDLHIGVHDTASHTACVRAVERLLALKPLPDAVLVSGDTANSGAPGEHQLARELFSELPMPVYHVAGNHDLFAQRLEYVVTVGALRLVVADTSQPGRDDGTLDVARLASTLDDDSPTIIAMHHPPIRLGMPWIDDIGLPEQTREQLAALLRTKSNVLAVLSGHVHRTATGLCGGIPVHTCTAAYQQAVLEFGATEGELGDDPPAPPRPRAARGRRTRHSRTADLSHSRKSSPCSSNAGGRWRTGGRSPSTRSGGLMTGTRRPPSPAPCRAPRPARRPRRPR